MKQTVTNTIMTASLKRTIVSKKGKISKKIEFIEISLILKLLNHLKPLINHLYSALFVCLSHWFALSTMCLMPLYPFLYYYFYFLFFYFMFYFFIFFLHVLICIFVIVAFLCTYMYICVYIYIYIYIYIYVYVCVCICIYIWFVLICICAFYC